MSSLLSASYQRYQRMFNSVVLLIYIFGQLVYVSPQLVTTVPPSSTVDEYSKLKLKCVTYRSNTYESFEWILNDDVIVTNYTNGREGVVGQRWRPEAYTAILDIKTKKVLFKLDISNSSRSDTGRWKCRGNSTTSDEKGLAVTVRYKPDSVYPICQLDGTGILQCTTQEGEPRVSLQWIDFNETPIRAEEVTRDSIILSTVNADVSLISPDNKNDSLTCQITQTDVNEIRRCSVSSRDIYSVASVTLSRMVDQLNGFICTVTPSRFSEYLVWEIGTDELSPEEENLGANGTRMIFQNIDSKWNGTIIKCVLEWGAWNDKYEIDYLLVDIPTTVLQLRSTNTPKENMETENKPTEVPKGDKPPHKWNGNSTNSTVHSEIEMFSAISTTIFPTNKLVTSTGSTNAAGKNEMKTAITSTKISDDGTDLKMPANGVTPSFGRSTNATYSTVSDGSEMVFTSIVFSANELMDSPATASSFSGALLIILVVVILAVVVILTVVFCLWRSKKDSPKATVV